MLPLKARINKSIQDFAQQQATSQVQLSEIIYRLRSLSEKGETELIDIRNGGENDMLQEDGSEIIAAIDIRSSLDEIHDSTKKLFDHVDFLSKHWNDISGPQLFNVLKTSVKHVYMIASKVSGMSQVLQQMQLDHIKNNITSLQREVDTIRSCTDKLQGEQDDLRRRTSELETRIDDAVLTRVSERMSAFEKDHDR
eukprot:750823-Hanusia_phi.AAC.2